MHRSAKNANTIPPSHLQGHAARSLALGHEKSGRAGGALSVFGLSALCSSCFAVCLFTFIATPFTLPERRVQMHWRRARERVCAVSGRVRRPTRLWCSLPPLDASTTD
ncbi:hypothetical protein PYCCODRAFT_258510 [Trametes coccinea BRFM310]|uniref:Transmembrane protein n=1 Tax=Trametes coccinea (strain BRFM310) TaxID=1353009 RepID=A0A1Y2ISW2_TRAC3|nr:hypothetical protein PYCCODRAFT_258510 [Trametes coccinea BRFM310]